MTYSKILAFILVLIASNCFAANHYILDGGTGDGSAWNNALDTLPSALTRGDTYYIGDGTYGTYIFDDAASGTDVITIKKATTADHGTETGWNTAYGDGQAIFTRSTSGNVWEFRTAYYTINGNVGGGPSAWEEGYGIKVTAGGTTGGIKLMYLTNGGGQDVHHLNISHVDFYHRGVVGFKIQDDAIYEAFSTITAPTTSAATRGNTHDITFSYCGIRNTQRVNVLSGRGYNWTFEYCFFADNYSCSATCADALVALYGGTRVDYEQHSEAIASYGTKGYVIRYCKFADSYGTAVIGLKENYSENFDTWEVYGNIFYQRYATVGVKDIGMGVLANTSTTTGGCTNFKFYNNTIVGYDESTSNSGVNFYGVCSNNLVYNNLWYSNEKAGFLQATHGYNCFIDTTIPYGSSLQSTEYSNATGTSPFYNFAGDDLSLSASYQPTLASGSAFACKTDVGTDYDNDMDGATRGSDGFWDVGAIEFTETGTTPPIAATASATNINSTTCTFNGTVNPNSIATSYRFDYGTTQANLSSSTSTNSAGSGSTALAVTGAPTGLSPGTVYYFRIYAYNSDGEDYGDIMSFQTSGTPITTTTVPEGVTTTVPATTTTSVNITLPDAPTNLRIRTL